MARDIEEFLKRAAERRRQQQQNKKGGGGNPPPGPPRQQPPRQQPPRQQQQPPPRTLAPEVITDVHVVSDPYASETVAEHVRKHITTDDVTENAEHLGDEVAGRDDRIEERISETFDHKVGQLEHKGIGGRSESVQDKTTAVTEGEVNTAARDLISLLQNPQTVAQSIMIAEILKRPDFD